MDTLAHYRLHELPPLIPDDPVMVLPRRLAENGYDQDFTLKLWLHQVRLPARVAIPALVHECNKSDAGFLAKLLLLSQHVPTERVNKLLGADLVERMLQWGLLVRRGDEVGATVDVHCVDGVYLLSDHAITPERFREAVFPISIDSWVMSFATPRWPFSKAADLCTGTGVHALLAAPYGGSVTGVDINYRALQFAEFNATLNGRSNVRFTPGSLLEPLRGEHDLILCNLPWVPTPDRDAELYRASGSTGQELMQVLCRDLHTRLKRGGWCAQFMNYPVFDGRNRYPEIVREWLGPGHWGIVIWNMLHYEAADYVAYQVATHQHADPSQEFDRWIRSYDALGITGVSCGMVYVQRLPDDKPDWTAVHEGAYPLEKLDWIGDWLTAQSLGHDPDWQPQGPLEPIGKPEKRAPYLRPETKPAQLEGKEACRLGWFRSK